MITALIFILGLVTGSFLNVCIFRLPRDMSIIKPRSKCTHCDHQIRPWENIPLISFILLGGKCSSCKKPISIRYPIVELLTAVVFLIIYNYFGLTLQFVMLAILFCVVIVLTFIDIDFQILPNKLLSIALIAVIIFLLISPEKNYIDNLIGGLSLAIVFLLIGYVGKLIYKVESMGMGDVKYAGVIGVLLGIKFGFVAFVISFFSAAMLIMILYVLKRIKRKQRLAFGPFLSLGCFVAFFWGIEILNWYMRLYK